MGVWSRLEGLILLDKNSKLSVRKLINEMFDDYRKPIIEYSDHSKHNLTKVEIVREWDGEGIGAAYEAKMFIDRMKEIQKDIVVDLTFTTRFL